MIRLDLQVDWTEVDRAMGRLMAAIQPKRIHAIAASVAKNQVISKYAGRWASQTDDTRWQRTKKEIQDFAVGVEGKKGFPLGIKPGFLTGTTFKSISMESDAQNGRVLLKGRWPQGSDCVASYMLQQLSEDGNEENSSRYPDKYFKWGPDGLEFNLGWWGGSPKYVRSSDLKGMQYVANQQWMYLDDEDIAKITDVLDRSLANAITPREPRKVYIKEDIAAVADPDAKREWEIGMYGKSDIPTSLPSGLQHIQQNIQYDAHIQVFNEIFKDYEFRNGKWVYRGGD